MDFNRCYLTAYPGKRTQVYISQEAYNLMGRPPKVVVSLAGDTISISPARAHGIPVYFNRTGMPYFIDREIGEAIGPGNKAVFDYDEKVRDRKRGMCFFFYFLVRSTIPAPNNTPAAPARV